MVFASHVFLFWFLPLVLLGYVVMPTRLRTAWLALASFVFYGWWRVDFLGLLLASTVVDFVAGGRIAALREGRGTVRRQRVWLAVSVAFNLGLLAYFKYRAFGVESLAATLNALGVEVDWTTARVLLPMGISFYTFQSMSYSLDIYRGDARPARSFADFLCYVSLFPQLVCGPIVRYRELETQLRERTHSFAKVTSGVLLFQAGFAKKILLADPAGGIADAAFAVSEPTLLEAWLGALGYTFQIYFDFSGYSDMAIGLGAVFGFTFPRNFNSPYKAASITEFWRRWHMTLSRWFRDYLYIPLGGNRRGAWITSRNLAVVFLLCGLWHGAAWQFLVWGAFHGTWLVIERAVGRDSVAARLPRPIPHLLTFLLVVVGWVFFRAETLGEAGTMLSAMSGMADAVGLRSFDVDRLGWTVLATAAAIAFLAPNSREWLHQAGTMRCLVVTAAFVLAVVHFLFQSFTPFLYFQF